MDFIKARLHIGRFIIVVVNTKAEHVDIEEHRSDFDSASLWINVNISFSVLCYHIFNSNSPPHPENYRAFSIEG
jgi:hypothetical protein